MAEHEQPPVVDDGAPVPEMTPEMLADSNALRASMDVPLPEAPAPGVEQAGQPQAEPVHEVVPVADGSIEMTGAAAAGFGIRFMVGWLGDEWQPDSQKEFNDMSDAIANYLRARGVEHVSPEWALVFTLGGYAGKRLHKPTTKGKMALGLAWIKAKFSR